MKEKGQLFNQVNTAFFFHQVNTSLFSSSSAFSLPV